MARRLRVLLVGLGHMGMTHGRAYEKIDGFELAGLCARGIAKRDDLPESWAHVPRFADYHEALATLKPDVVSINTWPDTHADFAIKAFESGAHVFIEKPLAETVEDAERVVATARRFGRKLAVGYSLRQSPKWIKFIDIARTLGKPLVMRMNLNQQSIGDAWTWHKNLMKSCSPIVDCGVHYVDAMCQMTRAKPVRVHAMGAHLTDEIAADMYNYGQLQVFFDDGSIGWYEAAWGPMISETAFFVKDVVGPKGSVSFVIPNYDANVAEGASTTTSSSIEAHGRTEAIRWHHSALRADQSLAQGDELIPTAGGPTHGEVCEREQLFLLDAIQNDVDLSEHMDAVVDSLRIVMAADLSIREKRVVEL
jgi:predicted dehydrogenase